MALTKLPKNAFGTGSVDDSKIEDGTIQNVELSGSLANDRLVNSTITFNGTSTALGGSVSVTPFVEWQSVITADGSTTTTGVAGNGYFIDTTSNTHTINLPASATIGDTIAIKDYAGTFGSNNLTIGRNGHNIQGIANDSLISTNRASLVLVYVDSTKGWLFTDEHNVQDFTKYISATGGTITTSGDYKYHLFTGDGCFVVSCSGSTGFSNSVSYLVVAGGGGGGHGTAGGGGAGGLRQCTSEGFTITATTYPITVGGGGTTGVAPGNEGRVGNNGSNSVFSTITSAGGGGGGAGYSSDGSLRPTGAGVDGGSGGGGRGFEGCNAGSGNTPPVSPSQGNDGGDGNGPAPGPGPTTNVGSAGGGGAGAIGGGGAFGNPTPSISSGPGGAGLDVSPNFPNTPNSGSIAGGGSGGMRQGVGIIGTVSHGGGAGAYSCATGTNGTSNTGGGGGGGGNNAGGGTGGKGLVIIKYKYQ